ncbi:MAG: PEP-CTERM sorting domain-containing protein [Pirellulaceae bacterium]
MKKKSNSKKVVATFGAAMTAMYMAPDVEAGVIDLSGNLPAGPQSGFFQTFDFIGSPSGTLDGTFDWSASNLNAQRNVKPFIGGYLDFGGGGGIRLTATGNTITTGMAFYNTVSAGTISQTVMFAFKTTAGNVGWMQVHYTASVPAATPLTYLGAAYDNMGGSIVAGVVPEPSSLGGMAMLSALALGAGRRSRRKKTA